MATSKVLAPTNVTIQIPEFTDQPDQRVNSNCLDKEADAINALNTQIANVETDLVNSAFCVTGATGGGATSVSITLPIGAMFDTLHPVFMFSIYRSPNSDANEGYGILKIDNGTVYLVSKTGLQNIADLTYNATTRVLSFSCSAYRSFMIIGQRASH